MFDLLPLFGSWSQPFMDGDKGNGEGGGQNGGNGDGANNNGGGEGKNGSNDAKPGGEQGGEQFKPIQSETELAAWKESTRKAILADVRKQVEADRKAADDKAAKDRERDEAEKRGEFDKVKADLATERDTAITERDALKTDVEKYETAIAPLITALETEIAVEYRKRYDDKASALDRLNWLTERKDDLIEAGILTADGTKPNGTRPTLPLTPKPKGPIVPDDEAARKAHERQTLRAF